ncbi:MAG: 4-alpha-glucanotransferase [bacterium]|jgi:4-alpha-glucanotransferase|nr:4-alpha-glucanotransferase [bacterium]
MNTRRSGVLLHPLSLPGPAGCGDLGSTTEKFLDFLASAGQSLWQMLPLGPTGYADSPYQCLSSMAGNPLLVSLECLREAGLLSEGESREPALGRQNIAYEQVRPFRLACLNRACHNLQRQARHPWRDEFEDFFTREGWWLHDYALFMALRDLHNGAGWSSWPAEHARRRPEAMQRLNQDCQEQILEHKFHQFLFFRELERVRRLARERGILLVGDMPIFVAFDSADVWAWRHYFRVDELGKPVVVAGVPPDYFSATGQRWGNPLYNWDTMRMDQWWWWRSRFHMQMRQSDVIRVDHFRGFEACWEIPGDLPTAEHGRWVQVPGRELFAALKTHLPHLQLIAEDLGLITPEVEALRRDLGLPGMKVLQFAFFTDARDPFLPHNYEKACVAYTGTHDNNTLVGFFQREANEAQQAWMRRYLGLATDEELVAKSLEALWRSSADWVVAPMQDLLELDAEARMNLPGTTGGNWVWRMPGRWPQVSLARGLKDLGERFGRNQTAPGSR